MAVETVITLLLIIGILVLFVLTLKLIHEITKFRKQSAMRQNVINLLSTIGYLNVFLNGILIICIIRALTTLF